MSTAHDVSTREVVLSAKQQVEALLRRLPDDCTFEDIQYHVYVLHKIQRGIESAEVGPNLTQEEIEEEFREWLTE